MVKKLAQIISVLFHPVLIPTLGFILLFYSGHYFSFLNWEAKRFVMMVVLFSTAVLPLLAMTLLTINPRFDLSFKTGTQRTFPLVFSSIFYYLGYILLSRINAYPFFKIVLIASVLVILGLIVVSLKWKISSHMASMGALTGMLLALSFRTGNNPYWVFVIVIMATGLAGSAQLYLGKNKPWHLLTGYVIGFLILYLVIYFV